LKDKVISPKEANESIKLLEDADTAFEFLVAKKEIKFSTLRWTPTDILQGFLDYRGARFQLEDAIQSGGMIKLDGISNVADRYTEFSVIYDLVDKKGRRLTNVPTDIVRSLQEDILYYNDTDPFKAVKRMYALSKVFKMTKVAQVLVPILNSDLGRLYQIIEDKKRYRTIRIDSTIHSGVNFFSKTFFARDTLYQFGGLGFWSIRGIMTFFSKQTDQWELIQTNRAVPTFFDNFLTIV
jgi:hypothetical protein